MAEDMHVGGALPAVAGNNRVPHPAAEQRGLLGVIEVACVNEDVLPAVVRLDEAVSAQLNRYPASMIRGLRLPCRPAVPHASRGEWSPSGGRDWPSPMEKTRASRRSQSTTRSDLVADRWSGQ
jgi:hypothetical protein